LAAAELQPAAGGYAAIRLSTELQPAEQLGWDSAQQQLGAVEKDPAEHGDCMLCPVRQWRASYTSISKVTIGAGEAREQPGHVT